MNSKGSFKSTKGGKEFQPWAPIRLKQGKKAEKKTGRYDQIIDA